MKRYTTFSIVFFSPNTLLLTGHTHKHTHTHTHKHKSSFNIKDKLVYSVFVGDGDSKAYSAVKSLDSYPLVKVRKEECLTHVAKRLRKNLKMIKPNSKTATYVQHKLTEW